MRRKRLSQAARKERAAQRVAVFNSTRNIAARPNISRQSMITRQKENAVMLELTQKVRTDPEGSLAQDEVRMDGLQSQECRDA